MFSYSCLTWSWIVCRCGMPLKTKLKHLWLYPPSYLSDIKKCKKRIPFSIIRWRLFKLWTYNTDLHFITCKMIIGNLCTTHSGVRRGKGFSITNRRNWLGKFLVLNTICQLPATSLLVWNVIRLFAPLPQQLVRKGTLESAQYGTTVRKIGKYWSTPMKINEIAISHLMIGHA